MILNTLDSNLPHSEVRKGSDSNALKRPKDDSASESEQVSHNQDIDKSSIISHPQLMNNAFEFKEDVLGGYREKYKIRESEPNHQKEYNTLPLPSVINNHSVSPLNETADLPHASALGPPVAPDLHYERDDIEPPTWLKRFSFQTNDPNSTRWKDFKHAFKFGKQRKDADSPSKPFQKKTEFDDSEEQAKMRASNMITTLLSGSPAALIPASYFLSDENGTRKAPIFLGLLGLKVEDVSGPGNKLRHYKLSLEYGVGPDRLRWTVLRSIRDFVSLHSKLKVASFQVTNFKGQNAIKIPKFPKDAYNDGDDASNTLNDRYLSTVLQDGELPNYNLRNREESSFNNGNESSSRTEASSINSGGILERLESIVSRGRYLENDEKAEIYTKKLENYLKHLILTLALRPQSNKLFQFFELSPIGVLLSYEQGYKGKQGYLIISSSSKAQGWRVGHMKFSDFSQMVQRHTNKWFLVRGSYIMYVSDIYSTTPLDVFLVDPNFKISYSGSTAQNDDADLSFDDNVSLLDVPHGSSKALHTHFSIKLENGERSLKLLAKSETQAKLWVKSIETMAKNSVWSKPNRFGSFAPVRDNCYAQWFVDGRDHFWAVSSAMEMARDVIYIHDWWLSPELYMRRPANGNQEWRLDRILKRKAEQGVKIYVIVYRNVGSTVVTDSLWTKHSLIDLHPNIYVIRSPNQWLQNTYFWAHHEKLCLIDHTIAFVGGIDLCYGRYDTPDHVLVDDSPHDFATKQNATEESIKYQKFPGKDYSNPRVKDFYGLDKPYDSMYDRESVPRMPWHDVHMMTAGQPATDLSRHFVQRWNYLLRQKRPSRPTPLLTPPPAFSNDDLKRFDLTGTCEVQILRSACNWSLGLKDHEQSIHDAYLKLIETSEHFVYIENQFFITSSAFDGTVIENRIGDALVDRIIRAHNEKKTWKAVVVIPLMPGFESQVDEAEGSSVRVIMQCQYMSISRGDTSIFAKLKKMKINPFDYIQFFSLRKWGRIGPLRKIVNEQLYIHSKIMLVDDRVALIGSANINERSQRGNRDSEVAAVVRDTELVDTTMNSQPYKAGKFAHTLRMRLMREHLGIDVDILDAVERRFNKLEEIASSANSSESKTQNFSNREYEVDSSKVELASRDVLNLPNGTNKWKAFKTMKENDGIVGPNNKSLNADLFYHSFNNRAREANAGIRDKKQYSSDSRLVNNLSHKYDVEGKGADRMESKEYSNYKLNAAKSLKKWAKESLINKTNAVFLPNIEQVLEFLEDDTFVENPKLLSSDEEIALSDRNKERWELLKRIAYLQRVAAKEKIENAKEAKKLENIGIFTKSGLNSVLTETGKANAGSTNTAQSNGPNLDFHEIHDLPGDDIPVVNLDSSGINNFLQLINDNGTPNRFQKYIDPYGFSDPISDLFYDDIWVENAIRNTIIFREIFHCQPDDTVTTWQEYKHFSKLNAAFSLAQDQEASNREVNPHSTNSDDENETEIKIPYHRRRGSVRIQDLKSGNELDDIMGQAPSSDSSEDKSSQIGSESNIYIGSDSSPGANRKSSRLAYAGLSRRQQLGEKVYDRETSDRLLSEIQGHLVVFPVDWLAKEIESGNWFYNMDRLPPIEIYD